MVVVGICVSVASKLDVIEGIAEGVEVFTIKVNVEVDIGVDVEGGVAAAVHDAITVEMMTNHMIAFKESLSLSN